MYARILDCNKKIDDLPKRINNMLTVGKQRRNESKEFEQEAERLRSEADSFCLRLMLNEAEESARNAIKRDSYAEAYEKSAIVSETNAKELEKITNEFRRIKGELHSEKERLERSLPKLEEKLAKKKENLARKREKKKAELENALWRVFQ